jgi:hypothetical protein
MSFPFATWFFKNKIFLVLILAVYFFIIWQSPVFLTGDEVFYYQQALHIQNGEWRFFENTQPLLLPLILAITLTKNIFIMRAIMALIMCAAINFLYDFAKERYNERTAFFTVLFISTNLFTLSLATSIYTEALSMLFCILSLISYFKIKEHGKMTEFIRLGLWLGLGIQSRVTGLVMMGSLTLMPIVERAIIYFKEDLGWLINRKFLLSMAISLAIFIPYLFLGGSKFLLEKTGWGLNHHFDQYFERPIHFFQIINPAFFIFFIIGLFSFSKSKNAWLVALILLFLIPTLGLNHLIFKRHFYPIIFFSSMIAGQGVDWFVSLFKKKIFITLFCSLLLAASAISVFNFAKKPFYFYRQIFFTEAPEGCLLLDKNWIFIANKKRKTVNLPVFDQPGSQKINEFKKGTYLNERFIDKSYRWLFVSYLSSYGHLYIDDKLAFKDFSISEANLRSYFLAPGFHKFVFDVWAETNVGGLGQVLFCEDDVLSNHEAMTIK